MADLASFRTTVAALCDALPGATFEDESDGAIPSWKIGGKMFACVAHKFDGVAVKCRDTDTARMLIDAGIASKAPYFHASWVRLSTDTAEDELKHRIESSYDIVRSGLTKKAQAALPERKVT